MWIPFFQREKTVDEETEEVERLKAKNKRLSLQYSNTELEAAIRKARKEGISDWRKTFGNPTALIKWFREH